MTDSTGQRIARKLMESAIGQELNISPAEETVVAQWLDSELAPQPQEALCFACGLPDHEGGCADAYPEEMKAWRIARLKKELAELESDSELARERDAVEALLNAAEALLSKSKRYERGQARQELWECAARLRKLRG